MVGSESKLDNILHFVYFTDASSINTSSTVPKNSRTDKTEILDVLCLYFLVLVCIVLKDKATGKEIFIGR
jgi:hypothetical protein